MQKRTEVCMAIGGMEAKYRVYDDIFEEFENFKIAYENNNVVEMTKILGRLQIMLKRSFRKEDDEMQLLIDYVDSIPEKTYIVKRVCVKKCCARKLNKKSYYLIKNS